MISESVEDSAIEIILEKPRILLKLPDNLDLKGIEEESSRMEFVLKNGISKPNRLDSCITQKNRLTILMNEEEDDDIIEVDCLEELKKHKYKILQDIVRDERESNSGKKVYNGA